MTDPMMPPKIELPEVTPMTEELAASALIGCELGVVEGVDVEVVVAVAVGDDVAVADAEAVGVAVLEDVAIAEKVDEDDAEAVGVAVAEV